MNTSRAHKKNWTIALRCSWQNKQPMSDMATGLPAVAREKNLSRILIAGDARRAEPDVSKELARAMHHGVSRNIVHARPFAAECEGRPAVLRLDYDVHR